VADYHLETGSTPVRPTMNLSIPEKIDLIKKLSEYISENVYSRKSVISSSTNIFKLLGIYDSGDDNRFSVNADNKLEFSYWYESYHNGSIYGRERQTFEFTDEICDMILEDLRKKYEKYEFDRLVKEEEDERIRRIKGKIVSPECRFL
jgi:hypothetical protein